MYACMFLHFCAIQACNFQYSILGPGQALVVHYSYWHFTHILVATCTYKPPIATGMIMELLTVSAGNSAVTSSHDQRLEPCSLHSHFILTMFVPQQFIALHTKMNNTSHIRITSHSQHSNKVYHRT